MEPSRCSSLGTWALLTVPHVLWSATADGSIAIEAHIVLDPVLRRPHPLALLSSNAQGALLQSGDTEDVNLRGNYGKKASLPKRGRIPAFPRLLFTSMIASVAVLAA